MELASLRSRDRAPHTPDHGSGTPSRIAPHETAAHDALPALPEGRLHLGHVVLDAALLRRLRQARLMSQQDLADDCWRRNIQLSLTTIKRAEAGRPVRFRIAREFARSLDVPVMRLLRIHSPDETAES
jgi:hypothetical protein